MRPRLRTIAPALLALALASGCGGPRLVESLLPTPAVLYARPLVLVPGARTSAAELKGHLERTGYRPEPAASDDGPPAPGRYRAERSRLSVHRQPFRYPDGRDPGGVVTIVLGADGRVAELREGAGEDGAPLDAVLLEPELLASLAPPGAEPRRLVPLERIPARVVQAVLAAEDRRFRSHLGVDWIRVAGAALANLRAGRVEQGGSTLTQQLVKNAWLGPERTLRRKLREAVLAHALELRHSKDEILEAYLNHVYLGHERGEAVHGVARGTEVHFGKRLSALTDGEAALLAGMIRAPNRLSPRHDPARARARRDQVLAAMREDGALDDDAYRAARAEPVRVGPALPSGAIAEHVAEGARTRLAAALGAGGEEAVHGGALRVFSTLDARLQRAAESAVGGGLRDLERRYPKLRRPRAPLEAALVALDPHTGDVLARVGGRDFRRSPFDRAASAHRQPGSVFKPLVALAALTLREGGDRDAPAFSLATVLEDRPLSLRVEGRTWRPHNHDGRFRGPVTLSRALADSLNVPFVRLGLEVGLVHVAETARRAGIESPLRPIPSLALGAFEVTPLELTAAYGVFASGGLRARPREILAAVAPGGRVLGGEAADVARAVPEDAAERVRAALEEAARDGTGRALRSLGVRDAPVGGKTGTTNEFRDAWFVAVAPGLVTGVWVGFDDGARVGLTGAEAALPVAASFLREALR